MKRGGLKKFFILLTTIFTLFSSVVIFSPVNIAYADEIEPNTEQTDTNNNEASNENQNENNNTDDEVSCEAGLAGFGWMLCPGQNLITTVIGWALGMIDDSMNWTLLAKNSSQLRELWQSFLDIANIIFAIVFMIMIYSMATSTGLSNYDIKKILPRLVVIAIAVNVSFYICAALVDLSNIAGKGVYSLMTSQMTRSGDAVEAGFQNLTPVAVSAVFGAAIAAVAIVFLGGIVVIGIVSIVIAITFRNLALVILVVVSPIAIALYMLPNTEKWGKIWAKQFTRMLVVYPVFMAFWGASQLVSWITAKSGGGIPFIVDVVCAIAPAIAILPIFKATGGLMGTVANKVSGSVPAKRTSTAITNAGKRTRLAAGARNLAGNAAFGLQNSLGDKPVIGTILRKPGFNSLVNNAQNFNAELDKAASASGANWAKSLSDSQAVSLVTTGAYTDAKGRSIRVTDTYKLLGAIDVAKSAMLSTDWHKAIRNINQRSVDLRNMNRNGEAAAILGSLKAAGIASKKAVVGPGTFAKLAENGFNHKDATTGKWVSDFDNVYGSGVAGFTTNLSTSKLSNLTGNDQAHMQSVIKYGLDSAMTRQDTSAIESYDEAINSYRSKVNRIKSDPAALSNMSDSAVNALNDSEYLRTSTEATAARSLSLDQTFEYYNSGDAAKVAHAKQHIASLYNSTDTRIKNSISQLSKMDSSRMTAIRSNQPSVPVKVWAKP